MPVAVGNVLEVIVNMTLYNQRFMSVFHYVVTALPTQQNNLTSQSDVLNLLKNGGAYDAITSYKAATSNQLAFDNMTAQYIYPVRYVKSSVLITGSGALADQVNAPNLAITVEKTSPLAGRKNRGSTHYPGVPYSAYPAGVITNAQAILIGNNASKWQSGLLETAGTGAWAAVILHRTRPLDGSYALWTSFTVGSQIRTMRRRTLGVGI